MPAKPKPTTPPDLPAEQDAQAPRIEYMALTDLLKRRHPDNPKDHDQGAIDRSFDAFNGFKNFPAIDERSGLIPYGHGRIEALAARKQQGRQPPNLIQAREDDWYVPTVRGVTFDSEAQLRAYLVADNRLTELGGWNELDLAALLQQLQADEPDLFGATGYDDDALSALLQELNPHFDPVDEDEQPRLDQKKPVVCPHCGQEFTPE